jgi:hypothetical protein
MFQVIPNARFLHRQLLHGPRFADVVQADAPTGQDGPCSCAPNGR